jgi:formiminotetrahydrofolate cyclodeaminase
MHAQIHDITDHSTEYPAYLVKIAAALDEVDQQHHAAMALPHGTDTEHAVRAARLALACARAAAWWRVLARKVTRDHQAHPLFIRAAVIAAADKRGSARFWRDAAADWQARAEHRPTSDAAGALSNWHELGVTA